VTQTQSIHRKLDIRRAVTSTAFVMILLVAVVGLFALFSIWSINRSWTDGMNRSAELRNLSIASLEAQVAFKVQVQEWKNILLRGDDPALLAKHHAAFGKQDGEVRSLLGRVAEQAGALGFGELSSRAASLAADHQTLTRTYEQTLSDTEGTAATLSAEQARDIDHRLRGIDRALESGIGQLATDIGQAADTRRAALIAGMDGRYETLRWFIIGVILFALLVTVFMLFGILRATRS